MFSTYELLNQQCEIQCYFDIFSKTYLRRVIPYVTIIFDIYYYESFTQLKLNSFHFNFEIHSNKLLSAAFGSYRVQSMHYWKFFLLWFPFPLAFDNNNNNIEEKNNLQYGYALRVYLIWESYDWFFLESLHFRLL